MGYEKNNIQPLKIIFTNAARTIPAAKQRTHWAPWRYYFVSGTFDQVTQEILTKRSSINASVPYTNSLSLQYKTLFQMRPSK